MAAGQRDASSETHQIGGDPFTDYIRTAVGWQGNFILGDLHRGIID
jgi:hypothetical protein